jgi:hypothetical protein
LYVKALTATTVSINIFDGGTGANTSQAIALTSGWQRVQVSRTSAAGTTAMRFTIGAANGTVLCWGAQAEAGAFATSYIPTTTSTVTRSADAASITGSLFSQWYNQSEGTFVAKVSARNGHIVNVNDTTANNRIAIFGQISMYAAVAGVAVVNQSIGVTTDNVPFGVALAYATNNFAGSLNGGALSTDTVATVPTVTQLTLGRDQGGSSCINGHIRSVNYYPARLADFQLQALTELPLVPTLDLDFLNSLYEA